VITLNYTISEQEYKDFYYFLGWLSPERKSYRIKYYFTSYAWYFGLMSLIFIFTDIPLDPKLLIALLAITILWYFYSNWKLKRHFYKYGQNVYNDSDKENSEMTIGESGITAKSKDADANYKWSAFTKKYETSAAYYLYMSSNIGLLIPKRVFRSAAEKEAFEKMLAQYLPLQANLASLNK